MQRSALCLALAGAACAVLATPAAAFDLNSYRAQHHLPPLSRSAMLAGAAYAHAHDMARRNHLDHNGFRARLGAIASTAAENVAYGCGTEDCAFRDVVALGRPPAQHADARRLPLRPRLGHRAKKAGATGCWIGGKGLA